MKKCNKCGIDKPLDMFSKDRSRPTGLKHYCKTCIREWTNARSPQRRAEVYHNSWKNKLKNYYGITIECYNEMFVEQAGQCKICRIHQSELKEKLHVDHCHDTKIVRGLLCGRCNRGIGMFKDSIELLEKAIKYLKDASV